jgi:hypothetical protein
MDSDKITFCELDALDQRSKRQLEKLEVWEELLRVRISFFKECPSAGKLEEVTLALTAIQSLVDLLAQLADEAEKLELREK